MLRYALGGGVRRASEGARYESWAIRSTGLVSPDALEGTGAGMTAATASMRNPQVGLATIAQVVRTGGG